ncbi:alkaline phosphatase PhoX [Actinomadura madurae]|uniref:alkaline phosphatase PhoX n=1 Tax=Actinomadura madurae TaxID=1993 RepID=UPI002025D346|nr:alkaline phosphatase PhoX [Actinomadura madurae]MCP9953922.1 PhoX family protein [Actinomadura madurae]MCQ0005299.1 PhoX family protein [Actinomadura madurae]MCQ0019386.1 PhoX family protein [Actinomadura madurae]URM99401.1 PhoX family protein [Actinomadura madurae]
MSVTRRGVVKGGAAGALSIALAGSLDGIFQTSAGAETGEAYGYGPLIPDPKGVLDLPKGFSYKTLSVEGDPISDGVVVPGHHDGMATFPGSRHGRTRLVRNHEQSDNGTRAVAPPS